MFKSVRLYSGSLREFFVGPPKQAEVCGTLTMEEEGRQQAGSKQLPAQRCCFPRGDTQHENPEMPVPIRMLSLQGQQHEGMPARHGPPTHLHLGLPPLQPPETPSESGGASPSPSPPASAPGRGLAARPPGSIFS